MFVIKNENGQTKRKQTNRTRKRKPRSLSLTPISPSLLPDSLSLDLPPCNNNSNLFLFRILIKLELKFYAGEIHFDLIFSTQIKVFDSYGMLLLLCSAAISDLGFFIFSLLMCFNLLLL